MKLFKRKNVEYDNLIIGYRVLTADLSTDEAEIVNKALRHYNAFKGLDITPEQELKLIEKVTLGEIKLD